MVKISSFIEYFEEFIVLVIVAGMPQTPKSRIGLGDLFMQSVKIEIGTGSRILIFLGESKM